MGIFACFLHTGPRYVAMRGGGGGSSACLELILSLLKSCGTCEQRCHLLSEPVIQGSIPLVAVTKVEVPGVYTSSFQRDAASLQWARGRRLRWCLLAFPSSEEDYKQSLDGC